MRLSHGMWHSDDGATIPKPSLCFLSQKHHTLPLLVIMISWSSSTIVVLENIPHPALSITQDSNMEESLSWQSMLGFSLGRTGSWVLLFGKEAQTGWRWQWEAWRGSCPGFWIPTLDHTHTSSSGAGPTGFPSESGTPHMPIVPPCQHAFTQIHPVQADLWMRARGLRMKEGWVMPEIPFLEAR